MHQDQHPPQVHGAQVRGDHRWEVTAVVTQDGHKLVTVQKAKKAGEKSTKSIREFNADEVVQPMTVDGVDDLVCVQKFKRTVSARIDG